MFCIPAGCASSEVCHILRGSPNQRQEPLLHLQGKGHAALHTHHWRQGLCQRGETSWSWSVESDWASYERGRCVDCIIPSYWDV